MTHIKIHKMAIDAAINRLQLHYGNWETLRHSRVKKCLQWALLEKARGIVQHDRILNGEPVYGGNRHA